MARSRMGAAAIVLMILSMVGVVGCPAWFTSTAADVLVPVEEEVKLGEELATELERELTFSDDRELTTYVRQLGNTVLREVDNKPEGLDFQFHLVDDDEMINAFAIPGGGIYIFTGLIAAMDNEAELVAVIGHEIAHVTRRHIAQRLVAAYGTELIAQAALGEEPGVVGQLVRAVAQQGFMMSYSREQERDADRWGVRYQSDSGYDPNGFITFFEKLAEQPSPPVFLSTHPPPTERIENIQGHIDELDRPGTDLNVQRFEQMRGRI